MTSGVSSGTRVVAREPKFGAIVPYRRYSEIRLTQLVAALRSIAPASVIGDWKGPFTKPPTDELGIEMLSIDGIHLSVLNVDAPPPAEVFDSGRLPNALLPNAAEKLRDHRAHAVVISTGKPVDRTGWIATARAATLLTWAIATVTQAEAFKWEDANNFAPISTLQHCASKLLPVGGIAVPAWARILMGRAHGQQKIIAGSYGLWAFGIPEIEYAPTHLPVDYLVMNAYAICEYLLRSNRSIQNGQTIGADDRKKMFRIETLQPGFFTKGPAIRLSLLPDGSR